MGTTIALLFALTIGQAPPATMSQWRDKWIDPQGRMMRYRDPLYPNAPVPFYASDQLCHYDAWYVWRTSSNPVEAQEAQMTFYSMGILYSQVEVPSP